MKTKVWLFFLLFPGFLTILASETGFKVKEVSPFPATLQPAINNLDSMIFDLASATITANYIDIPVIIKSDDVINGIDYEMKFNLAKLTFSATIDLLASDLTVISLSHYNNNDLFLRYTSTTLQGFPNTGVQITKIRFTLSSACMPVSKLDFTNITTLMNGQVCSNRVTALDFTKFIPKANFSCGPTCLNNNIQFTDSSLIANGSIANWSWTFDNGNTSGVQHPATTYTATGPASATLIVISDIGCKDTIVKTMNINVLPVSAFSFTFDCIKDSVFFTNSSSIPSGTISASTWNFGDQSTASSLTNPSHHYNASGLYTATLLSTSDFSCTATSTLLVNLSNKVSANFNSTSINNCLGSVIQFSDVSTYSLNVINGWNWDFGDGSSSTQQNPIHTYTTAGTFSVMLTSISSDGCKGTVVKAITIIAPPVVEFGVGSPTACALTSINFNDLSTTASGSGYFWSFGDGGTSTLQNPVHIYSVAGVYGVKLVVTTNSGCTDSLTKSSFLSIHPAPLGSFSLSNNCILTNIEFVPSLSLSSGSIVSWLWNFGDGNTSTLQVSSNTFSGSGSYTVTLTGVTDLGCTSLSSRVIVLSTKPNVNFGYSSVVDCSGETLNFSNLSTPINGPTYRWTFGDGGSSILQNPAHTFSTMGYYPIKLIVTNPGGCVDSLEKAYTVTLPLPPTALFSATVVANAVVSFSSQSTNAVEVLWNFGDQSISTSDDPVHTFNEIGTYKVCLNAYNSLNCISTSCKDIYVGLSKIVAVPSGFTPNEDNVNDVLKVKGGPFTEIQFRIFNEWGNLLFLSETQETGWDGTFNGEAQPVGVYEYVLKGKTMDNKKINLYGAVNLTR